MRVRRALLILPFLASFLFHWVYQPVNEVWTVKRFGCACPILGHENDLHFDANDFNLILWAAVGTVCGLAWWWLLRLEFADRKPLRYMLAQSIGLGVLFCICASRFACESWL